MTPLEKLRNEVAQLYEEKYTGRADWADWIYDGHVVLVADAARKIAEQYGGQAELAEAAGLLHDIADAVMKREDSRHEEESLRIARELLNKVGFSKEEIKVVVDDAIAKHSCYDNVRPSTAEGKAMAAADGYVHITSDFYGIAEKRRTGFQSPQEIAAWALPKIERDFHNKMSFDELRESVRLSYEGLKTHFQELA